MNELLKSLACSGSECLCWILVLFNIFAVFFLVFCSFWKVSRLAKIGGWVYSGVLVCLTILILFFHTCIYTLLATIFTLSSDSVHGNLGFAEMMLGIIFSVF